MRASPSSAPTSPSIFDTVVNELSYSMTKCKLLETHKPMASLWSPLSRSAARSVSRLITQRPKHSHGCLCSTDSGRYRILRYGAGTHAIRVVGKPPSQSIWYFCAVPGETAWGNWIESVLSGFAVCRNLYGASVIVQPKIVTADDGRPKTIGDPLISSRYS